MKTFISPEISTTRNILNHSSINFISHLASTVVYDQLCSPRMLTNGSPVKTTNLSSRGGLVRTQRHCKDISESLERVDELAKTVDLGNKTYQYHRLHGYGFPSSQCLFPRVLQFDNYSPFNMTHNFQPATCTNHGHPCYGLQWQ